MRRLHSFIYKVIVHKWLGIKSPALEFYGIDSKTKPYKWYWEQSTNKCNAWRPYFEDYYQEGKFEILGEVYLTAYEMGKNIEYDKL